MDLSFVARFLPSLLEGTLVTLELSVLAIAAALILGMVIALAALSSRKALTLSAGAFVQIIKDTSIVSAIAVGELMHQGKMLSERTAATYEIFIMVGLFYLVITSLVTFATRRFERRYAI